MASEVVGAPLSAATLGTVGARANATDMHCPSCGASFATHRAHCGARVGCRDCGSQLTVTNCGPLEMGLVLGDDIPCDGL